MYKQADFERKQVNIHRLIDMLSVITVIVIDKIVYDCTTFVKEHPGGETVVKAFAGEDCSWQFWRFHGKKEMEEFGRRLRVGKTDGVKNRYAEIPQYVGLRSRGSDDW